MITPPAPAADPAARGEAQALLEGLPLEVRRAFQPYAEAHPGHARTLFSALFSALSPEPKPPASLPAVFDRLHVAFDLISLRARGFLDTRVEAPLGWLADRLLAVSLAETGTAYPADAASTLAWKYFNIKPQETAGLDAWCAGWPEFHGQVFRLLARAAAARFPLDERARSALESACLHLGTALHLAGAAAAFRNTSGLGRTGTEMFLVAILGHATEFEGRIVRKYLAALRGNIGYLGEREYARIHSVARRLGVHEEIARRVTAECESARAGFCESCREIPERIARMIDAAAAVRPGGAR